MNDIEREAFLELTTENQRLSRQTAIYRQALETLAEHPDPSAARYAAQALKDAKS